jgi:hypothetical protein
MRAVLSSQRAASFTAPAAPCFRHCDVPALVQLLYDTWAGARVGETGTSRRIDGVAAPVPKRTPALRLPAPPPALAPARRAAAPVPTTARCVVASAVLPAVAPGRALSVVLPVGRGGACTAHSAARPPISQAHAVAWNRGAAMVTAELCLARMADGAASGARRRARAARVPVDDAVDAGGRRSARAAAAAGPHQAGQGDRRCGQAGLAAAFPRLSADHPAARPGPRHRDAPDRPRPHQDHERRVF